MFATNKHSLNFILHSMKKITLLLAFLTSISVSQSTNYLVTTGAFGGRWRAAQANETIVNLTEKQQSLTEWLTATNFVDGDAVWLAWGNYLVSTSYDFPTAGLSIYGGFLGTENSIAERLKVVGGKDWDFTRHTVIDGKNAGIEGTRVFAPAGVRANSVLDGFTITNAGLVNGTVGTAAPVVLRDGMTLQNCRLIANTSAGNGGAVLMNGGGQILNCYFFNNQGNSGGAVHCGTADNFSSTITNCLFENNRALGGINNLGGALRSQAKGILQVNNCIFKNNTAAAAGSAVHVQLTVTTNFTTLTNCLIYDNTKFPALYMQGGTLINCSVVDNSEGAVYLASNSIPTKIYNSVFWGTYGNGGVISSTANNNVAVIQNSAYTSLSSNVTAAVVKVIELPSINTVALKAPYFRSPIANNWKFSPQSALANAGNNSISGIPAYDIEGTPFKLGNICHIGAFQSTETMPEGLGEGKFKVFNQIRYNKSPKAQIEEFGLLPIVVPPQFLMIEETTPYKTLWKEVIAHAQGTTNEEYVNLDIEMWPYTTAEIANTQQKFLAVIDSTRKYNPYSKLGYYGVPNKPAYQWSLIQPEGSTNYKNWQAQNTALSELYKAVDYFSPSFYAYNNDTVAWRKFVVANVDEIKRLNVNKMPVYGYLWPQYHGNSDPWSLKWIDQERWNFQLELLYKLTDGIIIWTSNKDPEGNIIYFDETMPWWITTKNFMIRHNLNTIVNSNSSIQASSVQISIFPNPSYGQLNIHSDSELKQVTIQTLTGQTVYQQKLNSNQASVYFDRAGLYLVQVNTATGSSVQRWLVKPNY